MAAAPDGGDRLDRGARSAANRAAGRRPLAAEIEGKHQPRRGHAARARSTASTGSPTAALAIVDYKTGKAPAPKAVEEGFALQLGLLGLIARAGGFAAIAGEPGAHEYWSLAKDKDKFGKVSKADAKTGRRRPSSTMPNGISPRPPRDG